LTAYQADMAKFEATETQILGISVDTRFSNGEFGKQLGLTFPLLSDFKKKVVKDYGIYDVVGEYGTRATFVVDKEGIIRRVEQGNTAIDPSGAYETCSIFDKKKTPQ
jgi:peroxiredoxin